MKGIYKVCRMYLGYIGYIYFALGVSRLCRIHLCSAEMQKGINLQTIFVYNFSYSGKIYANFTLFLLKIVFNHNVALFLGHLFHLLAISTIFNDTLETLNFLANHIVIYALCRVKFIQAHILFV